MLDEKKGDENGNYTGKVSKTEIAYKVLSTSKNEFLVKIIEYKSQKRSYYGSIKDPSKWRAEDMGPWSKNDFSFSNEELWDTYKFTLLENARKLEGNVFFREMTHKRFEKIILHSNDAL